MKCADACKVPAGGALAVDRDIFSSLATEGINSCELIEVYEEEVCEIPKDEITVVASGPLTSEPLAEYIRGMFGSSLSFFDAAAPIVTAESIDMEYAFCASRYDKGDGDDYINCPMNKEEYETFYNALISAERAPLHDCDVSNPKVYEGCMPVEVMAQRGTGNTSLWTYETCRSCESKDRSQTLGGSSAQKRKQSRQYVQSCRISD